MTREQTPNRTSGGRANRIWPIAATVAVLAALATLATQPGRYVADARFEIYWGTSRYLTKHLFLWDGIRNLGRPSPYFSPVIGATVWLFRTLGASPAVAERLLHTTFITVGAVGTVAVLRRFRPEVGPLHLIAGLIYAFSPVVSEFLVPSGIFFHYSISPWLLLAVLTGVADRRVWRGAAIFALTIFCLGAINSASLLYALSPILPALGYLLFVDRSVRLRDVTRFAGATGVLSLGVGAAPLVLLAANAPVVDANLSTTELPAVVSNFSSWSESWRGLGSWLTYFLGGGSTQNNVSPYLTSWWAVALSFVIPLTALAVLWLSRDRLRLLFGWMLAVALILMVGLFPTADPPPLGRLLGSLYDTSRFARALRNGYKAGAGWGMAMAVLGAIGIVGALERLHRRLPRNRRAAPDPRRTIRFAAIGGAALVLVTAVPFWGRTIYSPRDTLAGDPPPYWKAAVDYLNKLPDDGRVLVLPGTNRSRYRWGYVGDDIFDAFLDQPHVVRSSLPQGTPEAANLLEALDREVSNAFYRPGGFAPIARRLGIKWVVIRNDLEWETINAPRPFSFGTKNGGLRGDPDLTLVKTFGRPGNNVVIRGDLLSEEAESDLPPVEIYAVTDSPGLMRTDTRPPLIVSGDGDAWPSLARTGGLNDGGPVRYVGSADAEHLSTLMKAGSEVIVTDTNRRRVKRATAEANYYSHTLPAGADYGRPAQSLFADPHSQSVATYGDAANITASAYGGPAAGFATSLRPANAFDRNPRTAWMVTGKQDYVGQHLTATFATPQRLKTVTLRQVRNPDDNPTIKRVAVQITRSDGTAATVRRNLSPETTVVDVTASEVTEVTITIDTVAGKRTSGVGFAEVTVSTPTGDLDLRERIRVADRLDRLASSSPDLAAQLDDRSPDQLFVRSTLDFPLDEEVALRREFTTATRRNISVSGRFHVSNQTPDEVIDAIESRSVGAFGSDRYRGILQYRGVNTLDGNPQTWWQADPVPNTTLTVHVTPRSITNLGVVLDNGTAKGAGSASRVRNMVIEGYLGDALVYKRGTGGSDDLPLTVPAGCDPSLVANRCFNRVQYALPDETVDRLVVHFTQFDVRPSLQGARPFRIAEIEANSRSLLATAPGTAPPTVPGDDGSTLPPDCRRLLRIDGRIIGVRVPPEAQATVLRPFEATSCGDLVLPPGQHLLESTVAAEGLVEYLRISDVDDPPGPSLDTVAAFEAATAGANGNPASGEADTPSAQPVLTPSSRPIPGADAGNRSARAQLDGPATHVVLGTAHGGGWFGQIDGGPSVRSVSYDTLNGWDVPTGHHTLDIHYQPQTWYVTGIAISGASLAVCALILWPGGTGIGSAVRRRRQRRPHDRTATGGPR